VIKTKEEARTWLRKILGPPTKTLEGLERDRILLLISLIEPFNATNNQHSFTEYYRIGDTEYHVTTFPNEDAIIEQILDDYTA
jgi:hypothetical protein